MYRGAHKCIQSQYYDYKLFRKVGFMVDISNNKSINNLLKHVIFQIVLG